MLVRISQLSVEMQFTRERLGNCACAAHQPVQRSYTTSGLRRWLWPSLFDQVVGLGQQGHDEPQRLCRLEIDHQLLLGRLFDREIGRLGALQQPVDR